MVDGSTGELYKPGNTAQEANSLGWDGKVYCLDGGKVPFGGSGFVLLFWGFLMHLYIMGSDGCESGGK